MPAHEETIPRQPICNPRLTRLTPDYAAVQPSRRASRWVCEIDAKGACFATNGVASCCTNDACTSGSLQCGGGGVQKCQTGTNGCLSLVTSTCGAGLACERSISPACVSVNWAEWPMPNIPQDVAAGAGNPESYSSDTVNGTVTDNVTKLMWQHPPSTSTFTQAGAIAYCSSLTLAGYHDWRAPSVIELASLIEYPNNEVINTAINQTAFGGTLVNNNYWTSTADAGDSTKGWEVSFTAGSNYNLASSNMYYVRCVR